MNPERAMPVWVRDTLKSVHLMSHRGGDDKYTEPYREPIGGLVWLSNTTCTDIARAAQRLLLPQDPSKQYWKVLLRILKCLKGTRELGLMFTRQGTDGLTAFADATNAGR